jgi:perosamine synthetase
MVRVKNRDEFIAFMEEKQISTGVHTMPLPLFNVFKQFKANIPTAMRIWDQYVILPLYVELKEDQVDYIIDAVVAFDKEQDKI